MPFTVLLWHDPQIESLTSSEPLCLPGCDGIPHVGGELHRQPTKHRHSEQAGLLVDNLPELPASGQGVESLANILSEDWNDGRPCITVLPHDFNQSEQSPNGPRSMRVHNSVFGFGVSPRPGQSYPLDVEDLHLVR